MDDLTQFRSNFEVNYLDSMNGNITRSRRHKNTYYKRLFFCMFIQVDSATVEENKSVKLHEKSNNVQFFADFVPDAVKALLALCKFSQTTRQSISIQFIRFTTRSSF